MNYFNIVKVKHKAFKHTQEEIEEIKSEHLEKTAYITLLALIKQIVHEKNLIINWAYSFCNKI